MNKQNQKWQCLDTGAGIENIYVSVKNQFDILSISCWEMLLKGHQSLPERTSALQYISLSKTYQYKPPTEIQFSNNIQLIYLFLPSELNLM